MGSKPHYDDTVTVTLKNGWVLAGYAWWWWPEKGGKYVYASGPSGFQPWTSSLTMKIGWTAGGSDVLGYKVDLYAMGPKGLKP